MYRVIVAVCKLQGTRRDHVVSGPEAKSDERGRD